MKNSMKNPIKINSNLIIFVLLAIGLILILILISNSSNKISFSMNNNNNNDNNNNDSKFHFTFDSSIEKFNVNTTTPKLYELEKSIKDLELNYLSLKNVPSNLENNLPKDEKKKYEIKKNFF